MPHKLCGTKLNSNKYAKPSLELICHFLCFALVFLSSTLTTFVQYSTGIYIYIYISGWIFQKVLAEIVQKDLTLSQKALISNRRNLGLFAPTSMRFPSKDSKSKDLSFNR